VDGALAWGRGKPPPAQFPSIARKPPTHHAQCRTRAPRCIASRDAPRRNPLSWRPRSRQELVNVVLVAILDAGVDTASPRGPQAVADPALAEGCHARCRPVGGIASVQSVREVEVLNLDRVAASGYPVRKSPCWLTGVRDESSSILHNTYGTLALIIRAVSLWSVPPSVPALWGLFYLTTVLSHFTLYMSSVLRYYMSKRLRVRKCKERLIWEA
jgi:hypothetical protein